MAKMLAVGPCYACGRTFGFDPELVCSVIVCLACNQPADLHTPDCVNRNAPPETLTRKPLCLDCVTEVNLRQPGKLVIRPGAYPERFGVDDED